MLLSFENLGPWRIALGIITALVTAFLVCPLVLIVMLSFDSSPWLVFPPPHWTLRWYRELFTDPDWLGSFMVSLEVGLTVTVLSVLLGLITAIGISRTRTAWRPACETAFLMPMILPVVVTAIALYAFFLRIHLNGTFCGFVIAHLILALPFSVGAILNGLAHIDPAIENAAVLCGSSRTYAIMRITLPSLRPALFSAAIFSFLASWDEVVVAIFMASPSLQTVPVRIWGNLQQDLSPVIAAVSTVLIVLSGLFIFGANFMKSEKK